MYDFEATWIAVSLKGPYGVFMRSSIEAAEYVSWYLRIVSRSRVAAMVGWGVLVQHIRLYKNLFAKSNMFM